MDGHAADRFHAFAISPKVVVPLGIILAASLSLNIWQYGVIQGQRSSNMALKSAAAQAELTWQQVELKRRQSKVEADNRVDQLYRELEHLSRLNNQILDTSPRPRTLPRTTDDSVKPMVTQ